MQKRAYYNDLLILYLFYNHLLILNFLLPSYVCHILDFLVTNVTNYARVFINIISAADKRQENFKKKRTELKYENYLRL